jgi:hypothetical protein
MDTSNLRSRSVHSDGIDPGMREPSARIQYFMMILFEKTILCK